MTTSPLPPPKIIEAAETVRVWMEENNHERWVLGEICDRRFLEELRMLWSWIGRHNAGNQHLQEQFLKMYNKPAGGD